MQTTGKLKEVTRDISGKLIVSFVIDSPSVDIAGGDALDITAERHKEKRSLSANSYFHALVAKIAQAAETSNIAVKNKLIREYGQFLYINGQIPTMTMKAEYEDEALLMEGTHLFPVSRDTETVKFGLMRGSHTYNTAEMARLIDGAVSEAKDLGIETLTPAELERMKAAWTTGQRTV